MNAAVTAPTNVALDVHAVREDFPILKREVYGKLLVYLDSAASAQKPRQVIDAESAVYEEEYANVHRGVHHLSQVATDRFEATRTRIQSFLNAPSADNIIFVRGGTEGVNLVAQSWGRAALNAGDEILISTLEHHANIVPWHLLAAEKGLVVKGIPIDDDGQIDMEAFRNLLTDRTKLVAITQMSNALGIITPIEEITRLAHGAGARIMLDGCQAVSHSAVDVQALDCDFYVFSGHKIYGPTGIGALYGKSELLADMPPWQGGGEMIARVSLEGSTFKKPPHRFEAGTPAIAQTIALKAALDYVTDLGLDRIAEHEAMLLNYATERLSALPGITIYGTNPAKASILSFTMADVHPHDIGTIVDREGVAVRVGHHCAQPIMQRYDIAATVRASFALYNTLEEVDALVASLEKVRELFA
ncbi:MAG: cysteine desulfurase [Rhodospirillaceae bacterium]|nr:cysteine desulfurase [Rhodospirillaceae bacterium]|tara:strand:+ start:10479 stop:11729 length:1251 start_codon:yes stop_codon:yes gene_type:complete